MIRGLIGIAAVVLAALIVWARAGNRLASTRTSAGQNEFYQVVKAKL